MERGHYMAIFAKGHWTKAYDEYAKAGTMLEFIPRLDSVNVREN